MTDWRVERTWSVALGSGMHTLCTSELVNLPACGLLGAAGLGKTFELDRLQRLLANAGIAVVKKRFVEVGPDLSAESLRRGLTELSTDAKPDSVLLLDALDEAMIPIRAIAFVVADWIQRELRDTQPQLMISCRTAVWPHEISDALQDVYGKHVALATLQPLTGDQQQSAVGSEDIEDTESFFGGIRYARADTLAEYPLTLRLLIRDYQRSGTITSTRCELFERSVSQLLQERQERHKLGTAAHFSPQEMAEASERLACFLLLSDQSAITLGDEPVDGCMRHAELAGLSTNSPPLDYPLLEAISRSGLCEAVAPPVFNFTHRLFAEYLAGRRLASLPLHQSRSMLASPAGWHAGVAGPLREAAAVAVSLNRDIAQWIAETDPEVIGLSDVVDDEARRTATLTLLEHCRNRRITDSQLMRGEIGITGLHYSSAEDDLKPVLTERHADSGDVLECAIQMVEQWQLSDLYSDLANLVLDESAPRQARIAAGYALQRLAPSDVRSRLLPLIDSSDDDKDDELKGIALKCNWPQNISARKLIRSLTPPKNDRFHGSYAGFLWQLWIDEFDASECRIEGLRWALGQFGLYSTTIYDTPFRIAQRIVHSALRHLDDPATADEILKILADCTLKYHTSPLRAIDGISSRDDERKAPLQDETSMRRNLIELIVSRFPEPEHLPWAVYDIPYISSVDDFAWLVERAQDNSLDMPTRTRFVEFTRLMPWMDDRECVETWLQCRNQQPISSILNMPLFVEIDSEAASQLRESFQRMQSREQGRGARVLDPPPEERLIQMLRRAENDSPLYFRRVCETMSLQPDTVTYKGERFLTQSPGWKSASKEVRRRIVDAAKSYLKYEDNDDPEHIRKSELNSIHLPAMSAIWLIQALEPEWLEALPTEWWDRWSWYITRETHFRLHGEPESEKRQLFEQLHRHSGKHVREHVRRLAVGQFTRQSDAAALLLSSILELFNGIPDNDLDDLLCKRINTDKVVRDSLREVAQFVLRRCHDVAAAVILRKVRVATNAEITSPSSDLLVALLLERCETHWSAIQGFLLRNSKVAAELLAQFASRGRLWMRHVSDTPLVRTTPDQIGELVDLLFEYYPPDKDPSYDEAHFVSPADEARSLRDALLNSLAQPGPNERADCAERRVQALKHLESKYGSRYAWLRRPRARAERNYRMIQRKAIPIKAVADILDAANRRLIRHDSDALDGILAAIESLERNARTAIPATLNRYWNTPSGQTPSPKDEEFVSDEICSAIKDYFTSFAVVVDREVQVFRRKVSKSDGGKPGSVVDAFFSVPSRGVNSANQIVLPIEVKRSCDNRVKTAMKDQLVDRYMEETGAVVGVYVLAWFNTKNIATSNRPKWTSLNAAKSDLYEQAKYIRESEAIDVRVAVIDLTLS